MRISRKGAAGTLAALSIYAVLAQDAARLNALIDSAVGTAAPSITVLLAKDDKTVYQHSAGSSFPDQRLIIASATKWISVAVLMTVVDSGKLSLDDRVAKFIPAFTGQKARITVRQLLSHTSGFPSDAPCLTSRSTTLERFAQEIAQLPLVGEPGTAFRYGGVSMQVAGRVAEIASGKSWNQLFSERIATPLGLTHTAYAGFGGVQNPGIGGGMISTASDYMVFLDMILRYGEYNGRRILSRSSIEEMERDQTAGAKIVFSPFAFYSPLEPSLADTRYGLGVWRERGGQEISSPGAFGFSPWIDRSKNYAGVLAVQSRLARVVPLYLKLKDATRGSM